MAKIPWKPCWTKEEIREFWHDPNNAEVIKNALPLELYKIGDKQTNTTISQPTYKETGTPISLLTSEETDTQPTDTQPTSEETDTQPTSKETDTQPTSEETDTQPTSKETDTQPTSEETDTPINKPTSETSLTRDSATTSVATSKPTSVNAPEFMPTQQRQQVSSSLHLHFPQGCEVCHMERLKELLS